MPKVSIIIPVYNVSQYLQQCLDSLVNQTFSDIEIICIDDCSTDNSLEILNEYAQKDNRIIIIQNKSNQGIGITRNIGIKRTSSNYIMFVDPDDWLELDACEKAYNQISKNKDDVVFFNSMTRDENGNLIHIDAKVKPFEDYFDGRSFSLKDITNNFIIKKIACWTKIYDKKYMQKNDMLFPITRRGEDILFAIKTYLTAEKVSALNYPLYNYRQHFKHWQEKEILVFNDAYINLRNSYKLVIQKEDNVYILQHFLVYLINCCIDRYFELKDFDSNSSNQIYQKSRNILKMVNKKHDIKALYTKIDLIKYKLFIYCPNSKIFNCVYSILTNIITTSDKKHFTFNLCKIKIKIRIKNNL